MQFTDSDVERLADKMGQKVNRANIGPTQRILRHATNVMFTSADLVSTSADITLVVAQQFYSSSVVIAVVCTYIVYIMLGCAGLLVGTDAISPEGGFVLETTVRYQPQSRCKLSVYY